MSLRRALQSSRTALTPEANVRATTDKPWSRRGWPREQLRAHWPHLTIQQVELLKEVFQLFDTEDKGYFTRDDLFFVMEAMGGSPTPAELDAVLYELDSNGDSVVDFPEFLAKFLTATDERELLSVFHQLAIQEGEGDDDRVLTLTAVERSFQYVGERLTDEDRKYLEVIFRGADKDGDGRLDIKEFTAYLEKMDDELFMGQAGALETLLAAANNSAGGGAAVAASGKGGRRRGGSIFGGSPRRSGGGGGDVEYGEAGGGGGTDAEVAAAMLAMASRALSGRPGAGGGGGASGFFFGGGSGLQDDVESMSSAQGGGGLRHSFLSKLTRAGRHQRSSVNSSTLAAGQLASLGVASSGRTVRVGGVGSAVAAGGMGMPSVGGLLHLEASEGGLLRSTSSARTGVGPPPGAHGHGHGPAGQPSPPGGGGGAQQAHFLVESTSMSALRLASSTGQLPAFLLPPPEDQAPVPPAATAPVALSRGGSFCDGAAGQVAGAHGGGVGGLDAALSGGGGGAFADGGGWYLPQPHPQPPIHLTHCTSHQLLQQRQYPQQYPQQQQQQSLATAFQNRRSHSMPAGAAGTATAGAASLAPLAIPTSLRDSDEQSGSGSASPFSPLVGAGTLGGGSEQRQGGGVHPVFGGRTPGGGLRSPVAHWQQTSVIQEAPEEGDSGYGGMATSLAAAGTTVRAAGATVPAALLLSQRMDVYGGRTSAPTRFSRPPSFPMRAPPSPDVAVGAGGDVTGGGGVATGGDVTGGGGVATGGDAAVVGDGRSSAGAAVGGERSAVVPPRPIRLGSGGEGRLGQRIGGLMAAMFSGQRSLERDPTMSAAAAEAAATAQEPPGFGRAPDRATRSSPSKAQLTPPPPAAAGQPGFVRQCKPEPAVADASAPAAAAASSGLWGIAASARAAMDWLRGASGLGGSDRGSSRGGGSGSRQGARTASNAVDAVGSAQPPSLEAAAAGAAAAASSGRAPLMRLTVEVPGSGSPGSSNSKPTSPAEVASSPGPSAPASMPTSPLPSYFTSPFTSPAAASAAAAVASVGPDSSPAARPAGPISGAAGALPPPPPPPPASPGPESGPATAVSSGRATPASAASRGPPWPSPSSPGRAAHLAAAAAAEQPAFIPLGPPQSPAPVPATSPKHPQHPHASLPQPLPEPSASPAWLTPPQLLPRPEPQVPSGVSGIGVVGGVSSRVVGGPAALGGAGARALTRSGSVGGSSRLAISSTSSPPVAPPYLMQRQQSLQHTHLYQRQQHSLQPQSPPLGPQQQQRSLQPQPPPLGPPSHRLSSTGLAHRAPPIHTPPPPQPLPAPCIPAAASASATTTTPQLLLRGDRAPHTPSGAHTPHPHPHPRMNPSGRGIGVLTASPGAGSGDGGAPPAQRAPAATAAPGAAGSVPWVASGSSPWGTVNAAAEALRQQQRQQSPDSAATAAGGGGGAGGSAIAAGTSGGGSVGGRELGESAPQQHGWVGGARTGHRDRGTPPRRPVQPHQKSVRWGSGKGASDPVAGASPPGQPRPQHEAAQQQATQQQTLERQEWPERRQLQPQQQQRERCQQSPPHPRLQPHRRPHPPPQQQQQLHRQLRKEQEQAQEQERGEEAGPQLRQPHRKHEGDVREGGAPDPGPQTQPGRHEHEQVQAQEQQQRHQHCQ